MGDAVNESLQKMVKAIATKIQSLRYQKIYFECFNFIQRNEIYIITIDSMHYETEEFWLHPSAKWYSQKKTTYGLTSINHDKCLWLRGPSQLMR